MNKMQEGLPFILNIFEISLDEIIKLKLESLKLIKPVAKNQLLYHYTNLEGLQKIIENNSFFFSNSAFLNDKQEFLKGSELSQNIIQESIKVESCFFIVE
jgi:hypothetical protein